MRLRAYCVKGLLTPQPKDLNLFRYKRAVMLLRGGLQGDVRASFREAFGGVARGGVLGSGGRGVVRGGFREGGRGGWTLAASPS